MESRGWTLLFHECILGQLERLANAAEKARRVAPDTADGNANVKLFRAVGALMLDSIPADPGNARYRQGNTLSAAYRHWRRAKIGRRFRLFFRYDSTSHVIIYAWINDAATLRSAGSDTDPYAVFGKRLKRGHPPNSWEDLLCQCGATPPSVR